LVWGDLQRFLQDPGDVLTVLPANLTAQQASTKDSDRRRDQFCRLLSEKKDERDKVVALFRRGRIDEAALDIQLDEIQADEIALTKQQDELATTNQTANEMMNRLGDAEDLLRELRARLDGEVNWDVKRQLAEVLVAGIQIETLEVERQRNAVITIRYKFEPLSPTCTGTPAVINCYRV
jgi:site-specific DNA recombinase